MERARGDESKYGWPPVGNAPIHPMEPPWDIDLHLLSTLWLETKCDCGRRLYPLRLMAANHGWYRTLRQIVPRLRCRQCERHPWTFTLIDDPAAGAAGRFGAGQNRWEMKLQ